MSTAMPQVPPRPNRAHEQTTGGNSTLKPNAMPKVPPRPIRRVERSISPQRESFARSPLNETIFVGNHGIQPKPSLYSTGSANTSSTELPRRPSSVTLPSIGQEGNEYAEVFAEAEELGTSPPQTRNVANDLHLHAPKPSLPVSSAKQRLSTVTRTDSGQAAAFGIGRPGSDDKDPQSRDLKQKASFASQTSNGTERPPSSLESDHGIPEIGQRVPMYPNAGDVQAPSPAPFATPYSPGIGFHNDGSKPRHHGRRTSARGHHDIPPDAYGRYGHGIPHPSDRFEKAYYEKHPELFKKELGQYGEGRPEWALSSDDLNKIVRDTASRGAGLGTSSALMGTPTEQIGFQASEEYTSRMSSPRPLSGYGVAHSNASGIHVESPLRKESFPTEGTGKAEFEGSLSRSIHAPSDTALESEVEDEDTIHVDYPARRGSKVYGAAGGLDSTDSLGRYTGQGGEDDESHDEHGYSAPILASDEVAKEPFGWELQPAVSPMHERRSSYQDDSGYHHRSGSGSMSNSRPSSRPGSIHGIIPGMRITDSTPLEDLEEYEPLFPEEEKHATSKPKPLTAADRLKRPELKNRKFPSQDIWEDTPNSLQYTATVSTPQLPEDAEEGRVKASEGETPEQAFARRQEELAEEESKISESFLHQEKKPRPWSKFHHLGEDGRPDLNQRFPSRDIWEDTPDSLQLQTTVASPQAEETVFSPPDERPTTGAVVYHQEKAAAGFPMGSEEGRATTGIAATMKPQIPARPIKSKLSESPENTHPAIPDRPNRSKLVSPVDDGSGVPPAVPTKTKPQVPARPSKPVTHGSSENVPSALSDPTTKSVGSSSSVAAAAKPKPPVPSRPVGSKIAALQGGFMSDLNKRLQLGPQAPKKDEPSPEEPVEEKEKAPLVDARKGRARGPARRAPAKSPSPTTEYAAVKPALSFSIPSTLWEVDPDDDFVHVSLPPDDIVPQAKTEAIQSDPPIATNTAGEALQGPPEQTPEAETAASPSSAKDAQAEQPEEIEKAEIVAESNNHDKEPAKLSDEPPVVSQGSRAPDTIDDEELAGSTATIKASVEDKVE